QLLDQQNLLSGWAHLQSRVRCGARRRERRVVERQRLRRSVAVRGGDEPGKLALSESQSKAASELKAADLCAAGSELRGAAGVSDEDAGTVVRPDQVVEVHADVAAFSGGLLAFACDRSEERRVGKECRSGWS